MLAPDTVLHPHPSLVFTRLDDTEAVLLHLDTKRYYTLNETGTRIWELLQQGRSTQAIVQALQDDYALADEEAMPVLVSFMNELRQEGLIHPSAP
ncbi:MAG: PqqD family protein [Nitrospira sp.]